MPVPADPAPDSPSSPPPADPLPPPKPGAAGHLSAEGLRLAVVVSRFNEFITEQMLHSAIDTFRRSGGRDERLELYRVPGSFELPVVAKRVAETGRVHAVVCLGCVIRGETDHYDHVVEQTAKGVREVATHTGVPCIFGVITCETLEQAIDRAGAKLGNQGGKAMATGIEMANLLPHIDDPDAAVGPHDTSHDTSQAAPQAAGPRP